MTSETHIAGLAEFKALMQDLPGKIEGSITRGALRAGLRVIQDAAKESVPVDAGDLRESIRIRLRARSQKFGVVRMHLVAGDKTAWYSHLVEYGTASFYTGKGRTVGKPYVIRAKKGRSLFIAGLRRQLVTHPGIKPQPFMRQAFDGRQAQALEAVRAYLANRIPREIKKAGKA